MRARALVPLPAQPDGVPWPTDEWARAEPVDAVAGALGGLLDEITSDTSRYGTTFAVAVAHRGRLVAERYGGELEHWDRPNEPVGPDTPLLSWSMAKSMLHAAVGILVGDGRLRLDQPVLAEITLDELLAMRDGLDFVEDYVDAGRSDVIDM